MKVDFLFKGSHPAFYWAAALLKQKGKTVAILPEPEIHSWELFPVEVLGLLGLTPLKTVRDDQPIQILTLQCRLGIFGDLEFTKEDLSFCSGENVSRELNRGLSFYAKGSDYPAVFGESTAELLTNAHRMEYFERPAGEVEAKALAHLKKMGITILSAGTESSDLPQAEQTIVLDPSRAKVFRSRFEFTIPMKRLPTGASNRMLFVEKNAPLIEMVHVGELLHVRTLLSQEPLLVEKMIAAIQPYFFGETLEISKVKVVPTAPDHHEWMESKSHVDSSKPGLWLISPAINPGLGERSLYVRVSELLNRKFKKLKQPIFEEKELFAG